MNVLNKGPEVGFFLTDSRAQAMITASRVRGGRAPRRRAGGRGRPTWSAPTTPARPTPGPASFGELTAPVIGPAPFVHPRPR